jgi:hypothetical protein
MKEKNGMMETLKKKESDLEFGTKHNALICRRRAPPKRRCTLFP